MVTNATFFVNRIEDYPIGCVGVNLPDYVKHNKTVVRLDKDSHGVIYRDNLCLFRCLALHLGREAAALYAEYTDTDTPVHDFAGVTLDDLSKIEATFDVNVVVYKLDEITDGKTTAELVRRSPCQYVETMYLNLYEAHFSYIKDIRMYSHSYKCSKCEQALWKSSWELHRHERTHGTGDAYIDLANTYLFVRAKIIRGVGTNLADDTPVAPINNWLHSLFSQVDVYLNDTLVTPSSNTYPFGAEAKKTQLTSQLWYKDTAGHMDATQENGGNAGLARRRRHIVGSRVVEIMGRLHVDLFMQADSSSTASPCGCVSCVARTHSH